MGFFLTPVILLQVCFVINSHTIQELYLRRTAFLQHLISTQSSSPLEYKFNTLPLLTLPYSDFLCIFDLGAYLFSSFAIRCPTLGRASLPLGLMYSLLKFEELPTMLYVATVVDSSTFYFSRVGGYSGMGREGRGGHSLFGGMPVQGVAWGRLVRGRGSVLSPA